MFTRAAPGTPASNNIFHKGTILVVACPYPGAGNISEALWLDFHHQGHTFINAYCHTPGSLRLRTTWDDDLPWLRRSAVLSASSSFENISLFITHVGPI